MPLVINGQSIDDALVETEFANIKAYHENLGNVSCCERDPEFRQKAKDNIVGRVLLAQEASRAMPPTPEADLEAALVKLKEEYGGEQWFYSRTGLTPETVHLVRRDLDLDQRVRRMLDGLVDADAAPTEDVLRQHYRAHVTAFMTAEEVRASHILKNPSGESRRATFDLLRAVRQELKAGGDFDALARKHSDRAEDGIDLGVFKRDEIAPEVEAIAFSMEVGEVSPIFSSQYGLHIVKVTERRAAVPRPFGEVRDEVEQHWRDRRREEKTRRLVEELKALAKVEDTEPAEAGV